MNINEITTFSLKVYQVGLLYLQEENNRRANRAARLERKISKMLLVE
jgi:hypothetical protein